MVACELQISSSAEKNEFEIMFAEMEAWKATYYTTVVPRMVSPSASLPPNPKPYQALNPPRQSVSALHAACPVVQTALSQSNLQLHACGIEQRLSPLAPVSTAAQGLQSGSTVDSKLPNMPRSHAWPGVLVKSTSLGPSCNSLSQVSQPVHCIF